MAASIQRYAAKGVWDPPGYSQAVKVTGAQTILFLSGQVAYTDKGGPAHPGDFKAQARATFQAIRAQVEEFKRIRLPKGRAKRTGRKAAAAGRKAAAK